jgi:hypothetical protein
LENQHQQNNNAAQQQKLHNKQQVNDEHCLMLPHHLAKYASSH